ncbi:hypothetical protein UVI_02006470 [Ustilaginoidea virens]|uniref:Uncharacterized protein n=1 Tax=Ustilaginoidea virens TaxID=1159556 RepID=A0A1B5L5J0_USTVR|nr:hypothetical protein UVI_02006470 [Ustilaginoidea virens]
MSGVSGWKTVEGASGCLGQRWPGCQLGRLERACGGMNRRSAGVGAEARNDAGAGLRADGIGDGAAVAVAGAAVAGAAAAAAAAAGGRCSTVVNDAGAGK